MANKKINELPTSSLTAEQLDSAYMMVSGLGADIDKTHKIPFSSIRAATGSGGAGGAGVSVSSLRLTGETDDNAAWGRAVTAAVAGNGVIELAGGEGSGPNGDYLIGTYGQNFNTALTGNLASNLTIIGTQNAVVRKVTNAPYVFFCNPVGIGTVQTPNTQSFVYKNIKFKDLTIVDDVVALGFSEYEAAIHANAVDGLLIENCRFIGQRGDAVHIGAGDIGGGGQNRHNRDVTIRDSFFDGINRNNRNAISVLDCDGFRLENCRANNWTRPGGTPPPNLPFDINTGYPMPGAIDFEPNGFTDDPILRNIVIDGFYVDNCGGSAVNLLLRSNFGIANPLNGFRFSNVFANNCRLGILGYIGDSNSPSSNDIVMTNFRCTNSFRPFQIIGGRGLSIVNGLFYRCGDPGIIGYVGGEHLRDFTMTDVIFEETGNTSGVTLQLRGGVGWRWNNVQFLNANGIAVEFISTNPLTNCTFNNTVFRNDPVSPYTTTLSFGVFDFGEGIPVIDSATVKETNSVFNGIMPTVGVAQSAQNSWAVNGSQVRAVPTTGRWTRGNTTKSYDSLEPGSPRGFYIMNTNVLPAKPLVCVEGLIPGGPVDPVVTGLPAVTITSSMKYDNNGRFTATVGGQSAYTATTYAITTGNPGVQIICRSPYSGSGGTYVGFNTLATPGNALTSFSGIWFGEGTVYSILEGGLNDPRGSFLYGEYWRVDLIFDGARGGATLRFYKSTDNGTTWVGPIGGGGSALNNTPLLSNTAAVRYHQIHSNATETIQILKIGTP